jgi:DNA-binding response OmpR family regulator
MALIGRTAKVLVVEDDESVRRTLAVALSMANFLVLEASTGAAALAVLERNDPDAVVVDLRLPDRQGGAVLQRLRSQDGPAWVAISALDRQEAETPS